MLLSPYFLMRMARESAYVITDRRAIHIKAGLFGRVAVASFSPQQLGSLSRVQHLDGSGDVLFMHASESGRSNIPALSRFGFFGVDDAKAVEEMLAKLAKSD